VNTCH